MVTSLHDMPGKHVASIQLAEHAAATATETRNVFMAPINAKITNAYIIYNEDITGTATNYTTVAVKAGSFNLLYHEFMNGTNATAHASKGALIAVGAAVDAGAVVQVIYTKAGTGLKIPSALLFIEYVGA